ncbi:hypothetical protein CLU83_0538 [Flavobacterium sp. 1]|uniref:hypothetical protein n=1 Tax=Flavobacterium sp. 1 TaxID=2035200 RepID=UPI000C23893B|nr:hypothetical protein [Flavobacterium sp. 1]PJJ07373.1 hypothetical protein CLU83_0538 [Flavobacterium sp. 1]
MKRFIGVLCCAIAFSACDDGDLVVDTINFDEIATSTCGDANNLLFKLKDSESLILNIPDDVFKETFKEEPTEDNEPIKLNISSTNQVVYNFYDGKVTSDNICDLIPPATPKVKTQWKASSGVIEVKTEAVKTSNVIDNSTKITGYKHNVIFKNITFSKGDGTTQFYESFIFGDYLKTITPLPLAFDQPLSLCDNSGLVYESNATESLTLNIDPALILNEVTPADKPRTGTIGLVKNKLVYRLFNSVVTSDYFCATTEPIVPTVKQEWLGKAGAIIEVTTTTVTANTFKHTIVLKNVSLEKGNSNFLLGDKYLYGELQTIKP